jgi:hypothetical protein
MIGMEMTQTHEIQSYKIRARFTEAQKRPATGIDEHARNAIDPQDVARRCACIIGDRAAGAEDLQGHTGI